MFKENLPISFVFVILLMFWFFLFILVVIFGVFFLKEGGRGVSCVLLFLLAFALTWFSLLADNALKVFKIIFVTDCPTGLYGLDCRSHCSQGCKNEACERENGHCTLGCKTSLKGPMCKIKGLFYFKAIMLWHE